MPSISSDSEASNIIITQEDKQSSQKYPLETKSTKKKQKLSKNEPMANDYLKTIEDDESSDFFSGVYDQSGSS